MYNTISHCDLAHVLGLHPRSLTTYLCDGMVSLTPIPDPRDARIHRYSADDVADIIETRYADDPAAQLEACRRLRQRLEAAEDDAIETTREAVAEIIGMRARTARDPYATWRDRARAIRWLATVGADAAEAMGLSDRETVDTAMRRAIAEIEQSGSARARRMIADIASRI